MVEQTKSRRARPWGDKMVNPATFFVKGDIAVAAAFVSGSNFRKECKEMTTAYNVPA
jgi:hypothetical protein